MPDTKHYTTRSLSFVELEGKAHISLCTEEGDYLVIKLEPGHAALLVEGGSRFIGNVLRGSLR